MLAVALFAALILDLLLGDPRRLPHPVRWIGASAAWAEARLRRLLGDTRAAGIGAMLLLYLIWLPPVIALELITAPSIPAQLLFRTLVFYFMISIRDLIHHAWRVYRALKGDDTEEAQRWVSYLVSRDTENLDREGLILSATESVAENISDGTVGVLIFGLLLGPAGALLFRLANTLDAMWGYKTERYAEFGWAAAKLDDLYGWAPARITAGLMLPAAWLMGLSPRKGWEILKRDAKKHSSPNSGYPEAVAAGVLGVRFGGPLSYHGRMVEKPTIGDPPPEPPEPKLLLIVCGLALLTVLLAYGLFLGLWLWLWG